MTLNQIKNTLIAFLEKHAQIRQVCFEDDFDFSAERRLLYPVANLEYTDSSFGSKKMNHNFKLVLGDLADENLKGIEDEIFSDMLQVAEDFITFLQYNWDFELTSSGNIQKFVDKGGDRTAGIVFKFSLGTVRPQNSCQTPTI